MRFSRLVLAPVLMFATALPAVAYMHARRGPTSHGLFRKHSANRAVTRTPVKPIGPRAMDSERATEIQTALIKSGYLSGTPSGRWDSESEAAMQKLQGNNGWQTKLTPDSRALILLGLGPKQDRPLDTEKTASAFSEGQTDSSLMVGPQALEQ
jgi:hypothetical protein